MRELSEIDEKVSKLRNQFRITRNKKKFCKASTSKVSDPDVQKLIRKYPLNFGDPTDEQLFCPDQNDNIELEQKRIHIG